MNYVGETNSSTPEKRAICTVFAGNRSGDLSDYLTKINYDYALQQSLILGIIQPSGVNLLINYEQEVNENTRFLYYSYTDKIEKLILNSQNEAKIPSSLKNFTNATYVITEISYGLEILCVIQISTGNSVADVDNLLQSISERLEKSEGKVNLDANEKNQINQLSDVTIYGLRCFSSGQQPTLSKILATTLSECQREHNYRDPLVYTMRPSTASIGGGKFMQTVDTTDEKNSHVEKVLSFVKDIKNIIRKLKPLMDKCLQCKSNWKLDQQAKASKTEFDRFSRIFDEMMIQCRQVVSKLRRGTRATSEVDQILSNERYSSLKTRFDTLYESTQQHFAKVMFIERLKSDQIHYKEVSDFLPHVRQQKEFKEIDAELKSSITKTHRSAVLCYSSDHLKQTSEEEWKKAYQDLKQMSHHKTKETSFIYIDFTQYQQMLSNSLIVTLPEQEIPASKQEKSTRK